MYRFLLSRQWVILTLVGLVLIPVMIKLGFWQFHRHEHRVARNDLVARSLSADPVPVTELTRPGRDVPREDVWRQVTASGTYDTKGEVVVRMRTDANGKSGYWVLTPLVLADGRAVLVNRGWIPATGDLTRFPEVPAPPSGKVTVTGRLRADETDASGIKDTAGLPPRQVMRVNSERRAKELHRPVLGGYIELTAPEPGDRGPALVPAPDHDSIGPHMAYAVQWWLFTGFVPVGWVILVRRERRDRAAEAAEQAAGAAGPEVTGAAEAAEAEPAGAEGAVRTGSSPE
ncbi:membrane protein [Streptomyces albireticuli]|uniref:SURF1-like protein n=1 Tax=Streptomyces albireticuli TaxID=1940 RepID=A0A1Z2L8Z4_9ACTN|nr:SURF1 family protein [Streptomyces albireticuli]ARZ70757.1 membrane protein [Streptomyces albireticuli]